MPKISPPPITKKMIENGYPTQVFARYLLEMQSMTEGSDTDVSDLIDLVQGLELDIALLEQQVDDNSELITNITVGAGLTTEGNYIVPSGTTYLDDTTSLYEGIITLDSSIPSESEYTNFSYYLISKEMEIKLGQQMVVFGEMEINSDLIISGELILKA